MKIQVIGEEAGICGLVGRASAYVGGDVGSIQPSGWLINQLGSPNFEEAGGPEGATGSGARGARERGLKQARGMQGGVGWEFLPGAVRQEGRGKGDGEERRRGWKFTVDPGGVDRRPRVVRAAGSTEEMPWNSSSLSLLVTADFRVGHESVSCA